MCYYIIYIHELFSLLLFCCLLGCLVYCCLATSPGCHIISKIAEWWKFHGIVLGLIPARSTFKLLWNCTHVLLLYVLFWAWRRCHFCFLSLPKTSNKQHCLYGNALSFQEQVLPQLAEIHLETGGEEGTNYTNTSCSEARHASCIFWYSATMFTGGLFFLIPSESVFLKSDFFKIKNFKGQTFQR